jgi:hypothetical protein
VDNRERCQGDRYAVTHAPLPGFAKDVDKRPDRRYIPHMDR